MAGALFLSDTLMPKSPISLGDEIRQLMSERSISDGALYYRDLTKATVTAVIDGRNTLPDDPKFLAALSHVLRCEPRYLLTIEAAHRRWMDLPFRSVAAIKKLHNAANLINDKIDADRARRVATALKKNKARMKSEFLAAKNNREQRGLYIDDEPLRTIDDANY